MTIVINAVIQKPITNIVQTVLASKHHLTIEDFKKSVDKNSFKFCEKKIVVLAEFFFRSTINYFNAFIESIEVSQGLNSSSYIPTCNIADMIILFNGKFGKRTAQPFGKT